MKLNTARTTVPGLWDVIREHEGQQFLTKKGLPFTYTIKGGELFTNRRERSITRSTFEKAYEKLIQDWVGEEAPKAAFRGYYCSTLTKCISLLEKSPQTSGDCTPAYISTSPV